LFHVIDLALLGLLRDQELHGYELKKRLREILGPLSTVSFGSLYPALARLERSGAVKAVEAAELRAPSIPMTGSLGGEAAAFRAASRQGTRGRRGKKVYGITEHGERRWAELMAEGPDDDRTFALKLAFCGHLEPAERVRLLERRRAQLLEGLSESRTTARSRAERLDRYVRSLMEHDQQKTEHEIAWLEGLIAAEQASDNNPGGTPS
jgi:DNA-binding PadR family transcriptional regulator